MNILSHDRKRIKNGTILKLKSGIDVICVNDRGYQISVIDVCSNRPLIFIEPSEIQTIFENQGENFSNVRTIQSKFSSSKHSGTNTTNLLLNFREEIKSEK